MGLYICATGLIQVKATTFILVYFYMHWAFKITSSLTVLRRSCKDWGWFGLLGFITPEQQPRSYQGGEMMMIKSVFWWRKPEYPEETTDLWQVTDESFDTYDHQRGNLVKSLSHIVKISTFY